MLPPDGDERVALHASGARGFRPSMLRMLPAVNAFPILMIVVACFYTLFSMANSHE